MSIVRNRLDQDDFVEDDGVGGYTDHGMDIFDEEENYSEDDAKRKWHWCNFVCDWMLRFLFESKTGKEIVQAEGQAAPGARPDGRLQKGGF